MTTPLKVSVRETTGKRFCVTEEAGAKVFPILEKAMREEQTVELSFRNVEALTTAFLNVAVGRLCREFDDEKIWRLIRPVDISQQDADLLETSVELTKLHYKNPKRSRRIWREALRNM